MKKATSRALLVLALWFGVAMVLAPMPGIAHAETIVSEDGGTGNNASGDPDMPDVQPPTKSTGSYTSDGLYMGMGSLRPTSQTLVTAEPSQSFYSRLWLNSMLWMFRLYFGW